MRKLVVVNGSELSKHERRDCEIYYLRWVFQEYFRLHNTSHEEYLFEDLMKFADEHHKNVAIYIEKYENPFPQINGNEELKMTAAKDFTILKKSAFIKVSFTVMVGPCTGQNAVNKFPISNEILFLRNWIKEKFKIKDMNNVQIMFKNQGGVFYETIEECDLTKTIEYYGIGDNAIILVQDKYE